METIHTTTKKNLQNLITQVEMARIHEKGFIHVTVTEGLSCEIYDVFHHEKSDSFYMTGKDKHSDQRIYIKFINNKNKYHGIFKFNSVSQVH